MSRGEIAVLRQVEKVEAYVLNQVKISLMKTSHVIYNTGDGHKGFHGSISLNNKPIYPRSISDTEEEEEEEEEVAYNGYLNRMRT